MVIKSRYKKVIYERLVTDLEKRNDLIGDYRKICFKLTLGHKWVEIGHYWLDYPELGLQIHDFKNTFITNQCLKFYLFLIRFLLNDGLRKRVQSLYEEAVLRRVEEVVTPGRAEERDF